MKSARRELHAERRGLAGLAEATSRKLIDSERGGVLSESLGYLERYTSKMAYASQRAGGQPIAEGACKSVIGLRCKRSGQRWFESGLAPCLRLRSLLSNHRLRACFGQVVARETT